MSIRFSGGGMIARHEALEKTEDELKKELNDVADEGEEFDPCFGSEEYS